MKASIVILGIVVLLFGLYLYFYSTSVFPDNPDVVVYPDRQSGIAILVVGIVCMAIGGAMESDEIIIPESSMGPDEERLRR